MASPVTCSAQQNKTEKFRYPENDLPLLGDRPFVQALIPVSCLKSSPHKLTSPFRHYRESGNPVFFVFSWIPVRASPDCDPGFAGMTANLCCEFQGHHAIVESINPFRNVTLR